MIPPGETRAVNYPVHSYRACDDCLLELQLQDDHEDAPAEPELERQLLQQHFRIRIPETSSNEVYDEENSCPVCGRLFAADMSTEQREKHIEDCLKRAEFSGDVTQQHRVNRMLKYQISEQESQGLQECVICFEDFKPGDTVIRLECLCVYHELCIREWFERKGTGNCPVHAVND